MKNLTLIITLLFLPFAGFSQSLGKITYSTEKTSNGYQIYAENTELMPMSLVLNFTLQNLKSSLPNDKILIIPAQSKKYPVATLSVLIPNKAYKLSSKGSYNFGDVNQTAYDKNYIYSLPFDTGKTYQLYQGYNGNISHQNEKALDFSLQIGDKIFAAREGIVIDVVENNSANCAKIECAKFNNKILIMHADGTFAEYLHLKKEGAEVNLGDSVTKGQFIGFSGNTGWSTGPHLHFAVFLNRMDGKRLYLPTLFKTQKFCRGIIKGKTKL